MQYQICKKYAQYAAWTYEIYMHNKHKYAKICKQIYAYMQKKKPCINMRTICTNAQICSFKICIKMHFMYVCVCLQCIFEYA